MAHAQKKSLSHHVLSYFWITAGAFLAAVAIQIFLVPNHLIDGGVVGVALILGQVFKDQTLFYWLVVILNIPFIFLAYKHIRPSFVVHMGVAVLLFAGFLVFLQTYPPFKADPIEVIVAGGALLGFGVGLIIRNGGCLDGTEILAILINRKKSFTVGQVVMFINLFIFGAYGFVTRDWHIALQSAITFIVAFKAMDLVIMGLDDLKSVLIISAKPKELADIIMKELGLGLTVMSGRGGFSGEKKDMLFIIIERLDLSELKEIVIREDPVAFMAIEDLHEVAHGKQAPLPYKKKFRGASSR